MSTNNTERNQLEEEYRIALDTRKFEIDLFWRRSNLFWLFNAAIFVGYYTVQNNEILKLFLSHLGLIASLCWFVVNKGSKYWQENWEQKVNNFEKNTGIHNDLFSHKMPQMKKGIWEGEKFSVSKVTIYFSCYLTFIWLVIFICQILKDVEMIKLFIVYKAEIICLFTIFNIITIEMTCRSSDETSMFKRMFKGKPKSRSKSKYKKHFCI